MNGNQGVVMNTGNYPLRTQLFQANFTIPITGYKDFNTGESFEIGVAFPTAFLSPPTVYLGNILSSQGYAAHLLVTVTDVSATGCKLSLVNLVNHPIRIYNNAWNLVAIGGQ